MKAVVIIAGGPSLTRADVAKCEAAGLPLLGINNAYQITSKLSWLYACDALWWARHHGNVPDCQKFSLEKTPFDDVVQLENTGKFGLATEWPKVKHGSNSGHQAINLAYHLGFKRIILLGFDMMPGEAGELHWHADHESRMNNPNPHRLSAWCELFEPLARQVEKAGVEVVNCSRQTALHCFLRKDLKHVLNGHGHVFQTNKREAFPWPDPEPGYTPFTKTVQPAPSWSDTQPVAILTVLRSGRVAFNNKTYHKGYIRAMARMIKQHVTRSHDFFCITDCDCSDIENVTAIECVPGLSDKYSMVNLFRQDVQKQVGDRQIFSWGMDTVFTGNIDHILSYQGQLCMTRYYGRKQRPPGFASSAVMSFRLGWMNHFFDLFLGAPELFKQHYPLYGGRGDQLMIYRHCKWAPHFWEDFFPGELDRAHLYLDKELPDNKRVLFFAGKHTPERHIKVPWVRENWRPGA